MAPARVPLPRRARALATSLAPPVLARAAAGVTLAATLPDVARTLRMWDGFLPIYARYRFTQWRWREDRGTPWPTVDAAWERRHEWGAPRVHALLGGLGGYYVKAAQVLAAKGDFIPRAWLTPLSAMFDAMPPRPWADMAADLERGLAASPDGKASSLGGVSVGRALVPWRAPRRPLTDAVFAFVDPVPLATASIAQVHAATLSPSSLADHGWAGWSGAAVVKIQNASARGLMDSDVRNLGRLAAFVQNIMPFDVGGVSVLESGVWGVRKRLMTTQRRKKCLNDRIECPLPLPRGGQESTSMTWMFTPGRANPKRHKERGCGGAVARTLTHTLPHPHPPHSS